MFWCLRIICTENYRRRRSSSHLQTPHYNSTFMMMNKHFTWRWIHMIIFSLMITTRWFSCIMMGCTWFLVGWFHFLIKILLVHHFSCFIILAYLNNSSRRRIFCSYSLFTLILLPIIRSYVKKKKIHATTDKNHHD